MAERLTTAQAIGALTAEISALRQTVDRDRADRKENEKSASESRDKVQQSLAHLEEGHRDILRRVDKIEPVADMVTGWRAKFAGAIMVLGFVGAVVWAGVLFFKEKIISILTGV
jgi:predicted phage tail protein